MLRSEIWRPSRAVLRALVLVLPLAACVDPMTAMNDIGRVRATVYRHKLPVADAAVAMPGDRLVPQAGPCTGAAAGGLFDPCRPDPDQPELDAAGLPKTPLGPWAGRSHPAAAQARAVRKPTAAAAVPARKPAVAKAAPQARKAAPPAPARKAAAKPAARAKPGPRLR